VEILALLTVGRTPEYSRSGVGSQSDSGQSFLQAGGNSLLGQALAAPVSSRLQRFFVVSRIKIDPQLTGVDNTPETHITIEQQLSREITLTYVTNLARAQQQIVRVEWNFSEDWAIYAVRDSKQTDYIIYAAKLRGKTAGFIIYGWIDLTKGCYDLYWIAVGRNFRKMGIGRELIKFMEGNVRKRKGRCVFIETSSKNNYRKTRNFYTGGIHQM